MSNDKPPVIVNPWSSLRSLTAARIALGRAGISLPTRAQLDFQLAHAQARDAVHLELDVAQLAPALSAALGQQENTCINLHSAATDRGTYLQRPDLGRRLDDASVKVLNSLTQPDKNTDDARYDIAFVIVDGLSALAIMQHAAPFLGLLHQQLAADNWSIAPPCIVRQGRVAIGDEVASLLGAKMVVVLIGERPGLSSPDSMGLYLTWMPHPGLTDASRNCISNVRPAGLCYEDAAAKLFYLLSESRRRQLSGVALKDDAVEASELLPVPPQRNFLLE
ncbi:ethanolamine ammonia-lyase subunit EutC [Undibacterium sp.]|uniref:ethanolamine ammonia-lyase subunit EutC n=1 Tax=Undibacterium sp. TaxID=1914977 RepID=UPI00374CFA3E